MLTLPDGYNNVGERMSALVREGGNQYLEFDIKPLNIQPETALTYHPTVEPVYICDGRKNVWGHQISDNDFVRVKRPKQQVANVGQRIFRMSSHELAFVESVLTRKPNLQIYRTHQTANMGDFVIIDPSDSQYIVGWVVELKMASGAAHAGVQLSRAEEAADHLELYDFKAVTGNPDEIMAILTRGRGAWKSGKEMRYEI